MPARGPAGTGGEGSMAELVAGGVGSNRVSEWKRQ